MQLTAIPTKKMSGNLLAALALSLLPAAQAHAGTTVYEPASSWQVDNESQICRLTREYRSGKQQITIRIEQFQLGAGAQITLIGKQIERVENRESFQVRLGSRAQPFSAPVADISLPDGRVGTLLRSVQFVRPSPVSSHTWPSASDLAAIDQTTVTAAVMDTVVLQTKSLAKAMEEMQKCHRRMIAGWGFDPVAQQALKAHAKPLSDPHRWLTSADYPYRPLFRQKSSIVAFRLNVDAAGKPTACFVPRSYTPNEFVETTCRVLLQRAAFAPARDAAAKPVASYYVNAVSWLTF